VDLCEHGNESSGFIKHRTIVLLVEQPLILKKETTRWSWLVCLVDYG